MPEYYVTKREVCFACKADGLTCDAGCNDGYIETQVPLLDVLKCITYRDLPDDGETRRLVRDNATISDTKLPL